MLISVENLSKSFGGEEILKNINMTVNEKGRYGLIGVNGAGKSTLLKIIVGALDYDSGELVKKPKLTVGYLEQNNGLMRGSTIIGEMRKVFSDVSETEARMRSLEAEMAGIPDHGGEDYKRCAAAYASAQAYFESRDGYNVDVKIKTVLQGMGFGEKDPETAIDVLSGGEKTRLAMARLLLEEPELLILDEPTNHLDFRTLKWLEDYLAGYGGAILAVSHDRYFLDKTVSHIYELERGKMYSYTGGYSDYIIRKAERREREAKEYEMQQLQIAQLQTYVDKNMARASTSASAKSRQKQLDSMELLERPDGDLKTMKIKFEHTREPYKDVLSVHGLEVTAGEERKVLCENIDFEMKRGERIAIIGDNGIGKSTLLKTVQGIVPYYKGDIEWGKNVSVSYYEQENLNLDQDKLALNELWDRFPTTPETEIRRALGNMRLTKEDVFKPVKVISGGERARLALCIIMLERSNVLILDEPTNHLDLDSKEILESALSEYGGTVLFVSHDRYLLNKLPTRIIEIKRDGATIYNGNYDYYRERCDAEEAAKREAAAAAAYAKAAEGRTEGRGFKTKEQRRAEAERKNRIRELERLIEESEARISELEEEMTREEVFSDYKLMNERCGECDSLRIALEKYYDEWTSLNE